jgi:hypothetical protein
MTQGLAQSLTEMGTWSFLGSKARPARNANNLAVNFEPENVDAWTSENPMGLHGLLQG